MANRLPPVRCVFWVLVWRRHRLRTPHMVLERGFRFTRDWSSDVHFTLESSGNIYKHVSDRKSKRHETPTLEDEGIVYVPEVVKRPRSSINLQKYPTGITRFGVQVISEYVYCTPVNFRWLPLELTTICSRRFGEIYVEVGVLRETKTSLVFSFKMTKVPENFR